MNHSYLKDKKFIILGDRDAVPSYIIAKLLEESNLEVVYRAVQCSLCCHEGTIDPEDQGAIAELAKRHGVQNMVAVLGQIDEEHIRMSVQTLTQGDPTGVGPLYGVKLGLPVYHALACDFRDLFDEALYKKHLGFYSKFYNCRKVEGLMRDLCEPGIKEVV